MTEAWVVRTLVVLMCLGGGFLAGYLRGLIAGGGYVAGYQRGLAAGRESRVRGERCERLRRRLGRWE